MQSNKAVLVTGAAGGMGSAAVRRLADAGYTVFAADVCDIEPEENIIPVKMDVTSEQSVCAARDLIAERTEGLYAVVHLAGAYTMNSFVEIEEKALERIFDINLMGVYRVNKAFLPLLKSGGGRIVIVTSELAPLDPLPFNGIYSVSKTALDSYAHALAMELNLIGVRVVTLRPGAFGEGMPKASLREMERMRASSRLYPDVADRFKSVMLAEIGTAKDPSVFAKKLVNIIEKKRPAYRYSFNNSLKLKLFSALPAAVQAGLLKRLLAPRGTGR